MSLPHADEVLDAVPEEKWVRPGLPAFPADMPGVERVAHLMAFEIARQIAGKKGAHVSATENGVWVYGPIDLIAVVEALMAVAPPPPPEAT